jgi:hypothetical protein
MEWEPERPVSCQKCGAFCNRHANCHVCGATQDDEDGNIDGSGFLERAGLGAILGLIAGEGTNAILQQFDWFGSLSAKAVYLITYSGVVLSLLVLVLGSLKNWSRGRQTSLWAADHMIEPICVGILTPPALAAVFWMFSMRTT